MPKEYEVPLQIVCVSEVANPAVTARIKVAMLSQPLIVVKCSVYVPEVFNICEPHAYACPLHILWDVLLVDAGSILIVVDVW